MNLSKTLFAVLYIAPNGSVRWMLFPDEASALDYASHQRTLGLQAPLIFKAQTVQP